MVVRPGRRERAAPLGEAHDEACQRALPTLEKSLRQPARRHRTERVAVPTRILGRDQALLAADPNSDRAPLAEQRPGQCRVERPGTKISAQAQHVVQLVRAAWRSAELRLDLLQRARVDQLPQLVLAE